MHNETTHTGIGELVRKMEDDYSRGNVTISEYVTFDMYDTINKIEAYLNSIHTSGEYDSLEREKPFFNIVTAASNIWYKATDIDRKNIKLKATKQKDVINAFLATVHLQNWMTKEKFGQYLNEWGRVLARYGSAVTKIIEKDGRLTITVVPWNRLICDPIDFDNNPKIEVLELSEAQLRKRDDLDQDQIEALCNARKARETLRKQKKDTKSEYIKLYEVHAELSVAQLKRSQGKKPNESDYKNYVQQMHIVAYVQGSKRGEYDDFTLYSGREAKDPYRIAHLIKEDGRTLAIGAVEHLFQPQWMVNHTAKSIKDELDLASKLIFQTSDSTFVGQNALSAIENGDILIHAVNQPLTQINNGSHDITQLQNFNSMWKMLGNEIVGISEAMLGAAPKAGTAWRQTEALLQESYSLFELMTENKGLYLEDMLREDIFPFVKKKMDTADEVSATLEQNDIEWLDSKFIKNFVAKESNRIIKEKVLKGETVTPEEQAMTMSGLESGMKQSLGETGNQRFFKPSDIPTKTWKEQFKGLEFDLEVDITGENKDYQSDMATLNTALQVVMNPAYAVNKEAQLVVGEILKQSSGLSPLQLSQVRSQNPTLTPAAPMAVGSSAGASTLPAITS